MRLMIRGLEGQRTRSAATEASEILNFRSVITPRILLETCEAAERQIIIETEEQAFVAQIENVSTLFEMNGWRRDSYVALFAE